MFNRTTNSRAALAAFSVALILASSVADARGGRGMSFGSRGARTWSAPPVTRTAPTAAQPINRSTTPQATQPGAAQRAPGVGQAARPGFLTRPGFMGGLFGGLLGAGLLGMLFGGGFLSGLSGLGSMLGLVLQLALVFFLVRWAMRAFARRSAPAVAGGPDSYGSAAGGIGTAPLRRVDLPSGASRTGMLGGLAGLGGSAQNRSATPDELGIDQGDLDTFETILTEIQTAYGQEDIAGIRRHTTPEMLSYLTEELTDNAERGVINRVSDVKLLSGDVAESWREDGSDFATAAMRYSLRDEVIDRDSGAVVETGASEATELWTFRRTPGGRWLLSAIQQA